MTLEERIAAYLDGELDDRAASAVEAALIDPAVGQLLGEELMLRELLGALPPDAAPAALVARIESSLGVSDGLGERVGRRLRATLAGSRPTLGTAVKAARLGAGGARVALSGVSTARAVAELPLLASGKGRPRPLWRRAASYLWRRRR